MNRSIYVGVTPPICYDGVIFLAYKDDIETLINLMSVENPKDIVINILALPFNLVPSLLKIIEDYKGGITCIAPSDVCSTILSRFTERIYPESCILDMTEGIELRLKREAPRMQQKLYPLFGLEYHTE